jgi:hypothetical protein
MDTDGRFPTPTTRRTIIATGAKLAYAAPLVAASAKLSVTNVAAAVSLGSTCKANSVFFTSVAFGTDTGGVFYSPACCACSEPPSPGAVCFFADYDLTNPECAWVAPADGPCFVICEPVPCSAPPCGPPL